MTQTRKLDQELVTAKRNLVATSIKGYFMSLRKLFESELTYLGVSYKNYAVAIMLGYFGYCPGIFLKSEGSLKKDFSDSLREIVPDFDDITQEVEQRHGTEWRLKYEEIEENRVRNERKLVVGIISILDKALNAEGGFKVWEVRNHKQNLLLMKTKLSQFIDGALVSPADVPISSVKF